MCPLPISTPKGGKPTAPNLIKDNHHHGEPIDPNERDSMRPQKAHKVTRLQIHRKGKDGYIKEFIIIRLGTYLKIR